MTRVDPYPKTVAATDAGNAAVEVPFVNDAASVIVKSDEIRIIARKKDKDDPVQGSPEINGSIKIIKEGTEDTDQACIIIQPDGSILIDGPKIIIGGGASAAEAGNGEGTQVVLGRGASEPIALGQQLVDRLVALENTFNAHFHNSGAGPTTPVGPASGDSAEEWTTILSKLGKTL